MEFDINKVITVNPIGIKTAGIDLKQVCISILNLFKLK